MERGETERGTEKDYMGQCIHLEHIGSPLCSLQLNGRHYDVLLKAAHVKF